MHLINSSSYDKCITEIENNDNLKREVMRPIVKRAIDSEEYWFEEGCFIQEVANDSGDSVVSIARARVPVGGKTKFHLLRNTAERYIIITGKGKVFVGENEGENVVEGDVVRIPENTSQRIFNTGEEDLIFYVICSPPFIPENYIEIDENGKTQ